MENNKENKTKVENSIKQEVKIVKKNNIIKYILIGLCAVFLIIIGVVIFNRFKNDDIKKVSKILPSKYYSIECITKNCENIAAYKGNKTGKYTVTLLNGDGDVVAKYKDKYDANAKVMKKASALGNDFFIFEKTNLKTLKATGYSIANKNGKEVYSTEKKLKLLNNKLVLMNDTSKGINSYSIITSKGKTLFSNINDYEVYADGKVISVEMDKSKQILDENGKIILSDYYVATSIDDIEGNPLYLLVEDAKNNSYSYFSLKSNKIIGDSFQNYSKNEDGTLTITKRENNSMVKYTLDVNGKQTQLGDSKTQSEIANELKKKVDSKKYKIYSTSIYDKDQKFVFADDLKNQTFGLYEIKTNKYTKIYEYKKDINSLYSNISLIKNEKNLNYYQVSCSKYNCPKNEFYVFDLENGKALYNNSTEDLKIQNYYQYEDNYKVIKYSYGSTNNDYKGKYVLYGNDNKEITKNNNIIAVVGKKLLVGYDSTSSLILYSAIENKVLNNDDTLGTKIKIDNVYYYKYQSKDNTILLNEAGKQVLTIDSDSDIIYSDKVLVYIKDKVAYIFDASSAKVRKYKFKNNEKMNDASGDLISPFRGALFINNSVNNYVKVLNSNGKAIKKIKKAEIQSVYKTNKGNVVIIVKDDTGKVQNYGLYIAK